MAEKVYVLPLWVTVQPAVALGALALMTLPLNGQLRITSVMLTLSVTTTTIELLPEVGDVVRPSLTLPMVGPPPLLPPVTASDTVVVWVAALPAPLSVIV